MFNRMMIASFGAFLITPMLFVFMAKLIQNDGRGKMERSESAQFDFIRIKRVAQENTRKRALPPKPKMKPMPSTMTKTIAKAQTQPDRPTQSLKSSLPKISDLVDFGNGPSVAGGAVGGGGMLAQGKSLMPLVRIEPQYPRKAAMRGTQGWVLLSFDITEKGTVENVNVVKSKPKRVFDRAAIKALVRWKYRPKVKDGKPVAQANNKIQLDFKLEGNRI
jgi:protein TonB